MYHFGELIKSIRFPESLSGPNYDGWRGIFFVRVCDAGEGRVCCFTLAAMSQGFVFRWVGVRCYKVKFASFRDFGWEKCYYSKREQQNEGAAYKVTLETP